MIIKEVLKSKKNSAQNENSGNVRVARAIALVLVVVTLASVFAIIGASGAKSSIPEILGAKGSQFTGNTYIAGKLQELFELLPYSEYPYFTTYGNKSCGNSSCSYCNGYNVSRYHPNLRGVGLVDAYNSWSCFGFARYAFLYIFGEAANGLNYYGNTKSGVIRRVGRVSSNTNDRASIVGEYDEYTRENLIALMSEATAGDIVQARARNSGGVGNHSMIFLKADAEGIYVLHNNAFRSRQDSSGNYYGYNRVLVSYYTYDTLMNTWNSIISVYRASEETYDDVWSKGGEVCTAHEYTHEGMDECVNCGALYSRFITTDCTGLYTLSEKITVYSEPYTSAEALELRSGKIIVAAKVINSLGETWYRVAGGGYFRDDGLQAAENSSTLKINMTAYPMGVRQIYFSYPVKGKVTSLNQVITNVSGYIINSSGKTAQSVIVEPQAKTFDIGSSDLNYKLKFGQLTLGNYTLIISAEDSDGCHTLFISPFTIAEEGEPIVKEDVEAPNAPVAETVFDKFVILKAVEGLEYSMDKKNWQTENIFTDLKPETEYKFYCRWAETQLTNASPRSTALEITTLKEQVAADPPKVKGEPGATKITLVAVEDHEYSMDGVNWQESPVFTGLVPATKYVFFQRDKDVRIPSEGLAVKTSKITVDAPDAPVILGRSDTTITIQFDIECEYAILEAKGTSQKLEWMSAESFNGEFTGLSPAREYRIYCRIPETDIAFASKASAPAVETTDKSYPTTVPEAPVILNKNSNSVEILAVEGVEYSLDGETFQKSNVFKGLSACFTYEVICRWAETETSYASENSEAVEFEIIPDTITSTVYNINEEKDIITGIESGTTVAELLAGLDQGRYASVKNENGILGGATVITTGNEIFINDMSGTVAKYTLVVKGDVNMDGSVTITDMLIILSMISETPDPESVSFAAADLNGDGRVNALDYAMIRPMIYGE